MAEPETVAVPKPRGRPKKFKQPDIAVLPVRQVCQWCATEVLRGQNPPILVTCPACQVKENAYLAQPPCPNCGARPGRSLAGVQVKDGHRDSCLTRALPAR